MSRQTTFSPHYSSVSRFLNVSKFHKAETHTTAIRGWLAFTSGWSVQAPLDRGDVRLYSFVEWDGGDNWRGLPEEQRELRRQKALAEIAEYLSQRYSVKAAVHYGRTRLIVRKKGEEVNPHG